MNLNVGLSICNFVCNYLSGMSVPFKKQRNAFDPICLVFPHDIEVRSFYGCSNGAMKSRYACSVI